MSNRHHPDNPAATCVQPAAVITLSVVALGVAAWLALSAWTWHVLTDVELAYEGSSDE